jgi:pumilio homology domain family member 6
MIRKLLKYGSKPLRATIVAAIRPHVRELIRHRIAADVIDDIYVIYATSKERRAYLDEFFGNHMKVLGGAGDSLIKTLQANPDLRGPVLGFLSTTLQSCIEKGTIRYSIVHRALLDYFLTAEAQHVQSMITTLAEQSIAEIVHTFDGARVAMECIWRGTVKDRKAILKSFKDYIVKIAKEKHGHMVLLAVFDAIDDTVLINKAVLRDLVKDMRDLLDDVSGRKVLLYLLAPRDSHYFPPTVTRLLELGDGNANSKKDTDIRRRELLNAVSANFVQYVTVNMRSLLLDSKTVLFAQEVIMRASGRVVALQRCFVVS